MKFNWDNVVEILKSNDSEKIAETKANLLKLMEAKAIENQEQGFSLHGVIISSIGNAEDRLKDNQNDAISLLQRELMGTFCQRHGFTIYYDVNKIKSGDRISVRVKGKKQWQTRHYEVDKVIESKYIVRHNHSEKILVPPFEIKISPQNFVVGVSKIIPEIPLIFFFFENKQ